MADPGAARHFPQSELPALVLVQHRHGGFDDRAPQVAVVIGAIGGVLHVAHEVVIENIC